VAEAVQQAMARNDSAAAMVRAADEKLALELAKGQAAQQSHKSGASNKTVVRFGGKPAKGGKGTSNTAGAAGLEEKKRTGRVHTVLLEDLAGANMHRPATAIGEKQEMAKDLMSQAAKCSQDGRHDKAIALYSQALQVFKDVNDKDSALDAEIKLGQATHARKMGQLIQDNEDKKVRESLEEGQAALKAGKAARAAECWRSVLAIYAERGAVGAAANVRRMIAEADRQVAAEQAASQTAHGRPPDDGRQNAQNEDEIDVAQHAREARDARLRQIEEQALLHEQEARRVLQQRPGVRASNQGSEKTLLKSEDERAVEIAAMQEERRQQGEARRREEREREALHRQAYQETVKRQLALGLGLETADPSNHEDTVSNVPLPAENVVGHRQRARYDPSQGSTEVEVPGGESRGLPGTLREDGEWRVEGQQKKEFTTQMAASPVTDWQGANRAKDVLDEREDRAGEVERGSKIEMMQQEVTDTGSAKTEVIQQVRRQELTAGRESGGRREQTNEGSDDYFKNGKSMQQTVADDARGDIIRTQPAQARDPHPAGAKPRRQRVGVPVNADDSETARASGQDRAAEQAMVLEEAAKASTQAVLSPPPAPETAEPAATQVFPSMARIPAGGSIDNHGLRGDVPNSEVQGTATPIGPIVSSHLALDVKLARGESCNRADERISPNLGLNTLPAPPSTSMALLHARHAPPASNMPPSSRAPPPMSASFNELAARQGAAPAQESPSQRADPSGLPAPPSTSMALLHARHAPPASNMPPSSRAPPPMSASFNELAARQGAAPAQESPSVSVSIGNVEDHIASLSSGDANQPVQELDARSAVDAMEKSCSVDHGTLDDMHHSLDASVRLSGEWGECMLTFEAIKDPVPLSLSFLSQRDRGVDPSD